MKKANYDVKTLELIIKNLEISLKQAKYIEETIYCQEAIARKKSELANLMAMANAA